MKISNLFCVFAVFALAGQTAFANATVCSSSDSRLSYRHESPNGGPARPPTESLVLDGQTLISITWPGGAMIRIAEISFAAETEWSKTTTFGHTRSTSYLVNATVTRDDASGTALPVFNDLVFCTDDVYIGPPIP